jgi:hypothetical protein
MGGGLQWSIATRASLLQGQCPAFCGSPALGAMGGGLQGSIATRASRLQGQCPAFCGSPAPGAMGGGLQGSIATRASLLQGQALHFVGAPPSGRWVVVCKGPSRRGRRSYRDKPCILWEPRPRGDGLWTGKLGARSPLQKSGHANFIGPVAERPERIERLFDLRQTAFFRDRAAWKA